MFPQFITRAKALFRCEPLSVAHWHVVCQTATSKFIGQSSDHGNSTETAHEIGKKKKSSRSLTYRNSFFQWEIPSSNRKSHLLFYARYSKVSVPGTAITTSFGMLRIVPALVSEIDEVMVKNPSQGWMGTHEHTNKNKKCNSF